MASTRELFQKQRNDFMTRLTATAQKSVTAEDLTKLENEFKSLAALGMKMLQESPNDKDLRATTSKQMKDIGAEFKKYAEVVKTAAKQLSEATTKAESTAKATGASNFYQPAKPAAQPQQQEAKKPALP